MRQRNAFTLIEMMVVIALTLFIIVILAQSFSAGLEVFRDLKAIGDLDDNLRGASALVRKDLAADHFEAKRRLSDPDIWSNPPREGFVRVYQGSGTTLEGGAGLGCPYATTHKLHLAVKLRGNSRESVFTTTVPAGSPLLTAQTTFFDQPLDARFQDATIGQSFNSPWAEVAYYLVQTGTTLEPNNPASTAGTPLFSLYRVQFVVVPDNTRVNNQVAAGQIGSYSGVSLQQGGANLYFNNPGDLINPGKRRFQPAPPNQSNQPGATLVLSNVVSFTARTLRTNDLGSTLKVPQAKLDFEDFPFDTGYDTNAVPTTTANPFCIKGIEVTIRVWDQRTGLTRQVSVIQDM
jgi:prepilin-type N-terminal cleavage/methylation domain-containing protein